MDKIDKILPVYKVIAPIDKIVPSFILFLALCLGFILLIGAGIFSQGIVLNIVDEQGIAISGVSVYYSEGLKEGQLETGKDGKVIVPLDKATIVISKDGYKEVNEFFEKGSHKIILEKGSVKFESSTKKIIFQDSSGARLEEKNFKVRIACSDLDYAETLQEDGTGILEFEIERNCSLYAEILEPLEFKGKRINLTQDNIVWKLAEIKKEKGNLRVKILGEDGKEIQGEFEVSLLDGYKRVKTDYANYGEVLLKEIDEGFYTLSVVDESGKYAAGNEEIEIEANKTIEKEIEMTKDIVSNLSFSVKDKTTKASIGDYSVAIYVDEKMIAEGEYSSYALREKGSLEIVVMSEGYLYEEYSEETKNLSKIETILFEMEKATEENSGVVEIQVVDEEDKAIKNAKIWLMNKEKATSVGGPYLTGTDGKKKIYGVKSGDYYLVIEKEPAYADTSNSPFTVDERKQTNVKAVMQIGKAKLVLSMQDETGDYLSGEAEVHSASGIEKYPLSRASKEVEVKAIGQAYVVFKSDEYSDYYSLPVNLFANKKMGISAEMLPLNIGEPQIRFEGFYKAGEKTDKLDLAEVYEAVFSIEVPYGEQYNDSVFHFRIGDSINIENESAAITGYSSGTALGAIKGENYTGDYEQDSELTNRDAKWINLEWSQLRAGIHFLSVKFRVKGTAIKGSEIPFYYRASFEDREINLPPTNNTQELYSATYKIIKTIGTAGVCSSDFCYDSESVLDKKDKLYVNDYKLKVGNEYEIGFSILNNSNSVYSSSSILLQSNCMDLQYEIVSGGQKKTGSMGSTEIEVGLGEYSKGTQAIFKGTGKIKGTANCSITAKIKAENNIVFEKIIGFTVANANPLSIEIEDKKIVADSAFVLKIDIKDSEYNRKKQAYVDIEIELPDNEKLHLGGLTNTQGHIEVNIPALPQNSIVKINATALNYASETITIKVGDFIGLPEQIRFDIETSMNEAQTFFKIDNLSEQDIYITNIQIEGTANGRINIEAFTAQMSAIKPRIIGKGYFEQPIRVQLAPNAKEMRTKEQHTLNLIITAEKDNQKYEYELPVVINISLGGSPDNEPCLSISMTEWKDATQNSNIESRMFTIKNNCVRNDNPIKLEKLRAKLVWQGNIYGNVEMSVSNSSGGRDVTLLNNRFVDIALDIPSEEEYSVILRFNSSAQEIGETAKFGITIDGKVKTDSGELTLQSQTINSELSIFDLEQCLVTENSLVMGDSADSKILNLDFSNCKIIGGASLDVKVCYMQSSSNSAYCPEENSSSEHLEIENKNFTINSFTNAKDLTIRRPRVPGAYDLFVYAKARNSSFWKQVKVVEFTALPKDSAFSLDKYKVFLLGKGSTSAIELTNNELTTQASVRACAKTWKNASKKFATSLATGAVSGIGTYVVGTYLIGKAAATSTIAGAAGGGTAILTSLSTIMPYLAIAVGVFVLFSSLFGGDDCNPQTHDIMAYLINMKESGGITDNLAGLNARLDKANIDISHDFTKQIVPIVFENIGLDKNPSYATITISARKHNYSDPTNYGEDSSFGPLDVRSFNQENVSEKIRVKIVTDIPEPELPEITEENFCTQGTVIGRTGETAMPRIKLDWTWNGISINQCDSGNPDYIYCDAVQFNIELVKKVQAIKEFMQKNKDNFTICPSSGIETHREFNANISNGKFGVSKSEVELDGAKAVLNLEIENKTNTNQSVKIIASLLTPEMEVIEKSETKILERGKTSTSFEFENLVAKTNPYYLAISFELTDEQGELVQEEDNSVSFIYNTGAVCETIKTSRTLLGSNGLLQYAEANLQNLEWTKDIDNLAGLQKMLRFDAYLIKDSYNQDFMNDFYKYYKEESFFDSPGYFTEGPEALYKFYEKGKLTINRRYLENNDLQSSGKYNVRLNIDFLEDWKMFGYTYQPDANINIDLYLIEFPQEYSVFYNLPFDGEVGLNTENGRQGYGIAYQNNSNPLQINEKVTAEEKAGSNALLNVKTNIKKDIKEINSLASNKGKIMEIGKAEAGYEIISYPNLATPVILKTTAEEQDIPFVSAYSLRRNSTPIEAGASLLFWTGAGQCYDFEGLPVQEVFRETPDVKAQAGDLTNWLNSYVIKWNSIKKEGNLYLKTVVYTPKDTTYQLVAQKNADFLTSNTGAFSKTVELSGINTMKENNATEYIDSVKKVLEGIKDKRVCMSIGSETTKFFWNPAILYEIGGTPIKIYETGITDCIK